MFKVEAHLGLDCERKNSSRSSKFQLIKSGTMKMLKNQKSDLGFLFDVLVEQDVDLLYESSGRLKVAE